MCYVLSALGYQESVAKAGFAGCYFLLAEWQGIIMGNLLGCFALSSPYFASSFWKFDLCSLFV